MAGSILMSCKAARVIVAGAAAAANLARAKRVS